MPRPSMVEDLEMRVRLGLVMAVFMVIFGVSSTPRLLDSSTAMVQDLPTDPVEIEVWWWGETEAPGSEEWLEAAQAAYSEQHPNVTFTNNLLSTDALLPSYEAAGQAQEGPTIMYLWGGI